MLFLVENDKAKGSNKRYGFWRGIFIGVFFSLFMYTLVLYYFLGIAGFNIGVNQESVSKIIRDRVRDEVAKELPLLVKKIKYELPGEIAENLKGFDRVAIRIGDGTIDLPREAGDVFKHEFVILAEQAISSSLNELDLKPYIEDIGQSAYDLTFNSLGEEIIGKTYYFRASQWLTVPIKIYKEE